MACDVPYPEPLHALRPIADTMAVALVLAPASQAGRTPAGGGWRLRLAMEPTPVAATACADAALETLRLGVPAARALPLLCAMAARPATVAPPLHLEAADGCSLRIEMDCAP